MSRLPLQAELAEALETGLAVSDPQLWQRARELLQALSSDPALGKPALAELGAMLKNSRAAVRHRLSELGREQEMLAGLMRKNREVGQQLEDDLGAAQQQGQEAWQNLAVARKLIGQHGVALLARLDDENLDAIAAKIRQQLLASPSAAALTQAMQSLADQAAALFDSVQSQDSQIELLVDAVYVRFSAAAGFAFSPPDPPNLAAYRQDLQSLADNTRKFCRRPINLIADRNSLAKKFEREAVSPLRGLFAQLRMESEQWLKEICAPLQEKIQEKRVGLEKHAGDLDKIRDQIETLGVRMEETEIALARLHQQEAAIERILALTQTS